MKKTSLLVLSAFMLFVSSNLFAQVVEEKEDNTIFNSFYDDHKQEKARKPFVYPYVRQADVVWRQRVWRLIDFREKMNQPFYYPIDPDEDAQGRMNLFSVIDRALKDGTIVCYEDDEFKTEADYQKILSGLGHYERMESEVQDPDGEIIMVEDSTFVAMNPMDIKSLRIKEDWYVDKQRSVRDVRILGFCFVYTRPSDDGSSSTTPLFWIRYNDPAVRNLLANADMYNPKNDVQQISYDDVFVKRLFTSYVTRTTNTQNRSISQYLTGLDALFQSDEIEEEIFNREQDMWEY